MKRWRPIRRHIVCRVIAITAASISVASPTIARDVYDQRKGSSCIGVRVFTVVAPIAEAYELNVAYGALVAQVQNDSPAATAEIRPGDIFVDFNAQQVEGAVSVMEIVASLHIGEPMYVGLIRDGRYILASGSIGRRNDGGACETESGNNLSSANERG